MSEGCGQDYGFEISDLRSQISDLNLEPKRLERRENE